jgi:hypothetical protein
VLKKKVCGMLVLLLLISMFTLVFNIQPAKTERQRDDKEGSTTLAPPSSDQGRREELTDRGSSSSTYWISKDKINVTYYFSEPKIEVKSNGSYNDYASVTMDGLPQFDVTGLPILPFKTAKVLLPFGAQLENASAIGEKKTPLLGSYLVEYGQDPVPLTNIISLNAPETNLPNETVYGSTDPFPKKLYSGVSVQRKMGYKILLMNIFPVEYIPKIGKLFYYESISVVVELVWESEGETAVFHGYSQHREIVEGIVDDPEVIETYPTPEQISTYQYVIITNEELNNTPGPFNFQALRNDKISRGISTTIVTVEWIYARYDGTRPDGGVDDQTRIRNFIIDAYNSWGIMYVLLGGDGDGGDVGGESGDAIIPHRGFYGKVGWLFPTIDYDIPSDMYYACLDGTFDYDGDGVYGESNDGPGGGEVDLFSEVYVGRACVDSPREVENFVRKNLAYQTTVATNKHLRKTWMVGEYVGFGGVAEWAGNYKDEIKEGSAAHGYSTIGFQNSPYSDRLDVYTLYDRDYSGNNWPKSDIIQVINDNVHLINHLGHANVDYMMKMTNPDVDASLTNDELYFIGYSQGCYCGAFDDRTTSSGSYTDYDCISEHLTTEDHGAVAFISNSRYGWGTRYSTDGASQHYDREFWDAVLGEDIFNIGVANQDSKEDNAGRISDEVDRWCYYEINLFGDPELRIKLPGVYEHDLDVALEAPAYLKLNSSSLLEATVYNRGLNDESDVELFLMINGTTVKNATISKLVKGKSYTINYPWIPTIEGIHNVTAYTPPVPLENNIADNIESASITVQVLPDILIVDDNDGSVNAGTDSSITIHKHKDNISKTVLETPPILYFDPCHVVGPPPDVGDNLTLTMRVDHVTHLVAWCVSVEWDPSKLELLDWAEGGCLKASGAMTFCIYEGILPGKIDKLSCTTLPLTPVDVPPAPDDLASFDFEVLNYTCCMGTWINLTYTELDYDETTEIDHTVTNANFTLCPCETTTSLSEFESALTTAGYGYMVWNESSMGNPPLDLLTQFKLVVWTCGTYRDWAVDPVDAATLEYYLAHGGSVLLEGGNVGFDHHADDFMVNVAHAIYQIHNTEAPGLTVTEPNHPVVNGLSSNFTWVTGHCEDGVVPANTGMEVIQYTGTSWTAVTAFEGTGSKVVYYAFPLFCLDSSEQETLAVNSVNWLLKPPRTFGWVEDKGVCDEPFSASEQRPSMATNSHGHLYVAYENLNPYYGFYEICVSKSIDNGKTWSVVKRLSWFDENLRYPSIAIDVGDHDNIFVAFEREWSPSDHDIFVLRYVGDIWDVIPVANTLGNDDRYPTIISEFQYGTADRQYISYEYVYSYDDRDLMFAKSTDDGATWSVKKLHGESDYRYHVHCQICITTTCGSDGKDYIYIAYKWGSDYDTAYDIVIDKSSNRGDTWTQQWVCDESVRNKNWPSITATHGGGTVVIAWHVYYDLICLYDVQYAFSTNNGESWSVGWLALETGVNEETPTLTVDGQESTSTYVHGYIHVAYWRDNEIYYRKASFSSPWFWTQAEAVTDTAAYVSTVYTKPALTTYRSIGGRYLPAVAWTDLRNGSCNVYYSTKGPMHTIDSNPLERTLEVEGESYTAPISFYWIEGSTHTVNASSPQYVSSDVRYVFESWSDGGSQIHTITAGISDQNITAYFNIQYHLSVTTNPSDLTPQPIVTPSGPWYPNGTSVTCTAQAVEGFTFDHWTVDETNQGQDVNPITIIMNEPHTAIAYYLVRDVAVTNIMPSKTAVGQEHCMNITIAIENQGDTTETFNATAYYNNAAMISPSGKNYTTITLASGNSTTITFTWDTTSVAYGNYTISVIIHPVPNETDTTDNTLVDGWVIVTIPGDINWNYKVDHKDLLLLAGAYGYSNGDPFYIPEADINNDSRIDHKDLLILAANYGKEA